jgi:hypothetical protein
MDAAVRRTFAARIPKHREAIAELGVPTGDLHLLLTLKLNNALGASQRMWAEDTGA